MNNERAFLPVFLAIAAVLCAGAVLAFVLAHQRDPHVFLSSASRPQATAGFSKASDNSLGLEVFAKPRPLPNVSFADASGRTTDLAAFRGKVVLLNLWATWCVPCRKEMPALDRLQRMLGGKEFTVLPVSVDRAGVPLVRRFYRELGLESLPIYVDPSNRITERLLVPGLPTSFLIDREGRAFALKIGPADWDDPQMLGFIRDHLPQRGGGVKEARR